MRFWMAYKAIEEDFIEITKFIPLEKEEKKPKTCDLAQKNIYSFKLADIIVRSCTKIDSLLKYLIKVRDISNFPTGKRSLVKKCKDKINGKIQRYVTINDYLNIFGDALMKDTHSIYLKKAGLEFKPFRKGFINSWWKAYNRLKHDFHDNLKEATLDNAVHSLGALFCITCLIPELRTSLVRNKIIWSPNFISYPHYEHYASMHPHSIINLFAETEIFEMEISVNVKNITTVWVPNLSAGVELPK